MGSMDVGEMTQSLGERSRGPFQHVGGGAGPRGNGRAAFHTTPTSWSWDSSTWSPQRRDVTDAHSLAPIPGAKGHPTGRRGRGEANQAAHGSHSPPKCKALVLTRSYLPCSPNQEALP